MKHILIPPFMMRLDCLEVDKLPKIFSWNPTEWHHSILLPYLQLHIPLHTKGIISYLPTRRTDTFEGGQFEQNILTPYAPE